MNKLILVDGHAIFYRAFHAFPMLNGPDGQPINAVFGFIKMIFDILKKERPTHFVIAFDHKEKTLRHKEYEDYKATRQPPPPELFPQMPTLQNLLKALNLKVIDLAGYEADDLIGTMARATEKLAADNQVLIVTGDRDALQLVSPQIKVLSPQFGFNKSVLFDEVEVKNKYGLTPEQIIDYKALRGDASDNIPGVKGIGEKQATELLQKYQTLENIYEHLSELTPSQRQKLEENKEMAYFSKKLATIITDAPIEFVLDNCKIEKIPYDIAYKALEALQFKSLYKSLLEMPFLVAEKQEAQASLF